MKGPEQGSLSLNVKPWNQPLIQLWSMSGNQGDDWKQALVNVGYDPTKLPNTNFQFVFKAVVGGTSSKT